MEEQLKQLMGEAYKENMTGDEIQAFFKNQVLGTGTYVNKDAAEAEKKKLQEALNATKLELQNKMTDDEKKAAADQALKDEIEQLKARLDELMRQKEEQEKASKTDTLGYYARKSCENELPTIKTMVEYIDLDNLSPDRIYGAFQTINKAAYAAMRAIERDAAEKE